MQVEHSQALISISIYLEKWVIGFHELFAITLPFNQLHIPTQNYLGGKWSCNKKTRGFPQTLHRNFKFCGMSISCYLEWLTKNTVSNSTGAAFTPSQTMETGAATFNMVKQNKCYDVRMIPNVLQNQRYIFWIASNTVEITLTWTHHIGSCSSFYFLTGFLHIFKNHFPYFFNAFSTLNQKTLIPSIPKIAFMEHNAKQHQQNCHQQ